MLGDRLRQLLIGLQLVKYAVKNSSRSLFDEIFVPAELPDETATSQVTYCLT